PVPGNCPPHHRYRPARAQGRGQHHPAPAGTRSGLAPARRFIWHRALHAPVSGLMYPWRVTRESFMQQLTVNLDDRSYPIHIGSGLLDRVELLAPHIAGRQVCIVTDDTVAPLFLERLIRTLADYKVLPVVLPTGEAFKNWATLQQIFDALLSARHDRRTTLIALGGGVIGDMTGFAAACYQRGVDFIQIPTTLLSQVDSSVGGKTGINHPAGKNMIGAFY